MMPGNHKNTKMTDTVKKEDTGRRMTFLVNTKKSQTTLVAPGFFLAVLLQSFSCYASGEDREVFVMLLICAEQVCFFVLAEQEIVQMEEA